MDGQMNMPMTCMGNMMTFGVIAFLLLVAQVVLSVLIYYELRQKRKK